MTDLNDFIISGNFPIFLSPKMALTKPELVSLIQNNLILLQQLLLKTGGIVFRNFPIQTAEEFSQFISLLRLGKFVNYIGGDSPRDKVTEHVYTSTEAPPPFYIPLHQELSFSNAAPNHIYFYCEISPHQGGETIIADAREIYLALDQNVKEYFKKKKLMYISNYYDQSKIMAFINKWQRSHKSWREVFETSNKADVEKKCAAHGFSWLWFKHNWLQIKQIGSAIKTHPFTQETVWFNQAHLYDFNPRLLGNKRYLAAKLFYLFPNTCLHQIRFADGTRIARRTLYHVMDILEANTVKFPWQKGDVMVLDNILSMHGRAPFSGQRRILTAMTK